MRKLVVVLAAALFATGPHLACGPRAAASDDPAAARDAGGPGAAQEVAPFKLGTFEHEGRAFVGVVLGESLVIDLAAANATHPTRLAAVASPTDMKDLIERYDDGLRARIVEIVRYVTDPPTGPRPAWLHELGELKVLPPVHPTTMLNVAVNYREHDIEMATILPGSPGGPTGGEAPSGTTSAPGIWEREPDDPRWNPYMFLKAPASIIAHGEAIRLPPGRTRVEWECELSLVIGRTAARVPPETAREHVFGYTIQNDVSDRQGRGDDRYGSDWLISKSHDTFAPLGPFITPREFVPDPQALRLRFSLNGEVLQEGTTAQMIHGVDELLAYASNILSLRAGDVIATGTLPGAGSARTPPVLFRPGDVSECTYEGIGTLINPVEGPR